MIVDEYIKGQTVAVYGFFERPELKMVTWRGQTREAQVFTCSLRTCQGTVNVSTGTKDHGSTSNLRHHVERCRGKVRLAEACSLGTASMVRKSLAMKRDGTITSAFARTGKGKVSYSTRQLTEAQTRCASTHPYYYHESN